MRKIDDFSPQNHPKIVLKNQGWKERREEAGLVVELVWRDSLHYLKIGPEKHRILSAK